MKYIKRFATTVLVLVCVCVCFSYAVLPIEMLDAQVFLPFHWISSGLPLQHTMNQRNWAMQKKGGPY